MKHKYTVSVHRAVYNDDSYQMYLDYDKEIHGKTENTKDSFERFLCQSPLYDPRNATEADRMPPKRKQNLQDKNRTFQDEGVYPKCHGTYHMYHKLDDKLFAIVSFFKIPHLITLMYDS